MNPNNLTVEQRLERVLADIRSCRLCAATLPFAPQPVVRAHPDARILLVGQAPGLKVQQTGLPWNDKSGERLRQWLGVDKDTFYNPKLFAIVPMGFCYPGKGKNGDMPPRPECAPTWHARLRQHLPNIELTILCGQYAQAFYLPQRKGHTLTETVANWRTYAPEVFALPHPSPRNIGWFMRHPWFEAEVVPALKTQVLQVLNHTK